MVYGKAREEKPYARPPTRPYNNAELGEGASCETSCTCVPTSISKNVVAVVSPSGDHTESVASMGRGMCVKRQVRRECSTSRPRHPLFVRRAGHLHVNQRYPVGVDVHSQLQPGLTAWIAQGSAGGAYIQCYARNTYRRRWGAHLAGCTSYGWERRECEDR